MIYLFQPNWTQVWFLFFHFIEQIPKWWIKTSMYLNFEAIHILKSQSENYTCWLHWNTLKLSFSEYAIYWKISVSINEKDWRSWNKTYMHMDVRGKGKGKVESRMLTRKLIVWKIWRNGGLLEKARIYFVEFVQPNAVKN